MGFSYRSGVQLKDSFFKRKNMEKTCFNSTLVQLKGRSKRMPEKRLWSFNSTLVQLKDAL